MPGNPCSAAIALALVISAGCAPQLASPVDHQRAIDRDDADRLAAQLAQLPGAVTARIVLHRATRDPLATTAPSPAVFSAVVAVDDQADRDQVRVATARLAQAALPELAPAGFAIEVVTTVHRPVLARVGPFSVEDVSRAPLQLTLALGCIAIAGLAGALAVVTVRARRHRLGNSAQ